MATFPPKILGQVTSCGVCPHRTYYSGSIHRCALVDEDIINDSVVAPFCPLPDYPSDKLAQMQKTIEALREPLKYSFGMAVLTHIAAKLKLNLSAKNAGITIPFKDGTQDRKVFLEIGCVTGIDARTSEVTFTNDGKVFKLNIDGREPLLREAQDEKGMLWHHHRLAA
jgi:hypothetical protein